MHTELRRPGVTLELLHLEYLRAASGRLPLFRVLRALPRVAARGSGLSMRQVHRAGEKPFVDYSGKRPAIGRRRDGRGRRGRALRRGARRLELHLRRGDAHAAERRLHRRATAGRVEYLRRRAGGRRARSTARPASRDACRYEPGVQRTYEEWAAHYGTAILPARPAKPRDKAKVEVAVQVARRWILARLRHETFFSLDGAERAHPRAARRAQRPADEGLRRRSRAAISSSASIGRRCSRCRPSASSTPTGARRASTSTTTSRSSATTTRCRIALVHETRRRAALGHDRRGLPARHARLGRIARSSSAAAHDGRRAHAARAPHASGVESVALDPLGRDRRAADGSARRSRFSRAVRTPSRAIARVSACSASRSSYGAGARRGGRVRARRRRRRALLSPRRFDAQARPRSAAARRPTTPPPSPRLVHDNVRGPAYYHDRRQPC